MTDNVHQNVLIATPDSALARLALEELARRRVRGVVVAGGAAAMEELAGRPWDLVMVELSLPDADGLELLRGAKADCPELPVVMIAEETFLKPAIEAVRCGCEDVLVKPVSREVLATLFETLLPGHEVPVAASAEAGSRCLYRIAGSSPALVEVMSLARRVAPTSVPVLVTGESGTGKELISYFLHAESQRAQGPYIRVNCAALSESLLESELFGHERGAFTGAYRQRKGRFERAHGGTLLLDEVSETAPRLQAELLRVLEQQDFERVGGSEPVRVNVRVVCTSNRDLAAEVRRGRFRKDLYYRIGGVRLRLPALRERKEDIPVLVWHFVNLYAREVRRRVTELDEEMLRAFERHTWPGNVRELRNVVRTALILGTGGTLALADAQKAALDSCGPAPDAWETLRLREVERKAIFEALRRTQQHQAKAAGLLGITDRTLREKLRRYRREGQLEPVGGARWLVEPA